MSTRLSLGRRTLLKRLGLAAAATAPTFRRGILHAQASNVPKRFVFLLHCNGIPPSAFFPSSAGALADLTLPGATAPLGRQSALLSKTNIFRGVGIPHIGPGSSHQKGMYVLLTGRADDNRAPTGISIDQYLAKTAANQATPLPSVQTGLSGGNFRVSAAAAYEPLPPIKNPADAFSHMFQGFVSGDATNVGPDPEFLKLRAQKKSILDFAAREIGATRAQLGATDRERLDVHLESVREIERRLDLAEGSIASSTNSCGGVHSSIASDNLSGNGLPTGTDSRGNPLPWYENSVNIPFAIGLHLDMLVAALACGRTNVATFMAGGGTFVWQYPWITEIPSAVPDGANTSVTVSAGNHSISHIPARTAPYHEYVIRWYSEIYSDFAAKLDQIQERDGQTLLDHSFVGWSSENGDGPGHNTKDNHWVTWGSAGGYFNTGRYFDFHSSGGRTVNDLYLDVAEAFGSPTASFGDPAFVNGPLEGLRA